MTKNRNKKKRENADSMDVSEIKSVSEAAPQAMDTTETGDAKQSARARNGTNAKGKPMKRTQTARKKRAVARAIASNEKSTEKASQNIKKIRRTLSAKKLYE